MQNDEPIGRLLKELARRRAQRTEMHLNPYVRPTSAEAKAEVALLIGSIHLEWHRERKQAGL